MSYYRIHYLPSSRLLPSSGKPRIITVPSNTLPKVPKWARVNAVRISPPLPKSLPRSALVEPIYANAIGIQGPSQPHTLQAAIRVYLAVAFGQATPISLNRTKNDPAKANRPQGIHGHIALCQALCKGFTPDRGPTAANDLTHPVTERLWPPIRPISPPASGVSHLPKRID